MNSRLGRFWWFFLLYFPGKTVWTDKYKWIETKLWKGFYNTASHIIWLNPAGGTVADTQKTLSLDVCWVGWYLTTAILTKVIMQKQNFLSFHEIYPFHTVPSVCLKRLNTVWKNTAVNITVRSWNMFLFVHQPTSLQFIVIELAENIAKKLIKKELHDEVLKMTHKIHSYRHLL